MLNYVAGARPQLPDLRQPLVLARHDVSRARAVFPQGKVLPDAATWPVIDGSGRSRSRSASSSPSWSPSWLWVLYPRTRFGFEAQVIGDSPRAARYAGMRTRRKIVAMMALSGAIAGLGGASQIGRLPPPARRRAGLQQSNYGYTGIVVAALARYNPFAVVLVAFLLGGLQNAGYTLQGADFPSGLVGVMQGMILFAMLGGELLVHYRIHGRPAAASPGRPRRRRA